MEQVNVRKYKFKGLNINYTLIFGGCTNTDAGHTDRSGDTCKNYKDTYWCGKYDDDDFQSKDMCCLCGGGSTSK